MKKNTHTKFLILTLLFIALLTSSVFAENGSLEIIKYGTMQEVEQTTIVTTQISGEDTIYINQYSSDYLFSIGAAKQNPNVCLCSTTYDKIFVTNTAPYEATFTIITNQAEIAKVPFSTFRLGAGKTIEVLISLSAPCSKQSGEYDYNILVSNNFGTQYTLERKLIIDRCQSIQATLYATANEINPCEQVNYTIELKNVAPFTEQYSVTPKGSLSFIGNAKYEVTLASAQKTYLNFTYAPDCSIYGKKEIEFNVESLNNELSAKLNHNLIINRAYDFSVATTENYTLCRDVQKQIPISITNLADFENEFEFIILNKQDFIESTDKSLIIGAGEQGTFTVYANPTRTTKTSQVLEFQIKTKLGELVHTGKINLQTYDCHVVDINILSNNNPKLCAGTYDYDVEITNRGIYNQIITLKDDSGYAEVFPDMINLIPGETRNVSLILSLPNQDVKDISIKVTAKVPEIYKEWEDSFKVDVTKKYDCTLLEYETTKLFARYGTENVTFRVKNEGTLESDYELTLEGAEFLELETDEITLKPGESTDVMINLYADSSEVQKRYEFTIKATADNGEFYENTMTLRMADIPWLQKFFNKITSTPCYTTTSILILILILAVIAITILAWKRVRIPLTVKIIALALIAVIIILLLVFNGLPESRYQKIDKDAITSTNLIWHEDRNYKLDLNEYFFDPDNDTLTFYLDDEVENITVKIDGAKAILIPDKDWYGSARIRFLASDNFGGDVTSERINIEVLDVAEFSFVDYYTMNCIYFNALILILILLLLLALRTRKESGPMQRKVLIAGLKKQKGYLYYVDRDGDVARAPMARSNKKNQKFTKEKVAKTITIKKRK